MDNVVRPSFLGGDATSLRQAGAAVKRRRRILALLSGSPLIVTTTPFASAAGKLPPFKGD